MQNWLNTPEVSARNKEALEIFNEAARVGMDYSIRLWEKQAEVTRAAADRAMTRALSGGGEALNAEKAAKLGKEAGEAEMAEFQRAAREYCDIAAEAGEALMNVAEKGRATLARNFGEAAAKTASAGMVNGQAVSAADMVQKTVSTANEMFFQRAAVRLQGDANRNGRREGFDGLRGKRRLRKGRSPPPAASAPAPNRPTHPTHPTHPTRRRISSDSSLSPPTQTGRSPASPPGRETERFAPRFFYLIAVRSTGSAFCANSFAERGREFRIFSSRDVGKLRFGRLDFGPQRNRKFRNQLKDSFRGMTFRICQSAAWQDAFPSGGWDRSGRRRLGTTEVRFEFA